MDSVNYQRNRPRLCISFDVGSLWFDGIHVIVYSSHKEMMKNDEISNLFIDERQCV